MSWWTLSDMDPSMELVINVQENSRLLAEFTATHEMETPSSIWARMIIDDVLISTKYMISVATPASPNTYCCGHLEFLTGELTAGEHVVQIQFYIEDGNPIILDRVLTVIEIASGLS